MKHNPQTSGLTLVELLVIISLIGILLTAILANVTRARTNASNTAALSCAQQLQTAQTVAQTQNGEYAQFAQLKAPACSFATNTMPRRETPSSYRYAIRHPRGNRTYVVSETDLRWTRTNPATALTLQDSQLSPLAQTAPPPIPTSDDTNNLTANDNELTLSITTESAYNDGLPKSSLQVTGPEPGRRKIEEALRALQAQPTPKDRTLALAIHLRIPNGTYTFRTEREWLPLYNPSNLQQTLDATSILVKVGDFRSNMRTYEMGHMAFTTVSTSFGGSAATTTIDPNTRANVTTINFTGRQQIWYVIQQRVHTPDVLLLPSYTMRKHQNIGQATGYLAAYKPSDVGSGYAPSIPPCQGKCWLDPNSGWKLVQTYPITYSVPPIPDVYNDSYWHTVYQTSRAPKAQAHIFVLSDFHPIDPATPMTSASGRPIQTNDTYQSQMLHGGALPPYSNSSGYAELVMVPIIP